MQASLKSNPKFNSIPTVDLRPKSNRLGRKLALKKINTTKFKKKKMKSNRNSLREPTKQKTYINRSEMARPR